MVPVWVGVVHANRSAGSGGGHQSVPYAVSNPIAKDDVLGLATAGCDEIQRYGINETPCRLECCAQHDRCYDLNNCSSGSWPGSQPKMPCDLGGGCQKCNADVKDCFKHCLKKELFGTKDDPKKPNYYCGRSTASLTSRAIFQLLPRPVAHVVVIIREVAHTPVDRFFPKRLLSGSLNNEHPVALNVLQIALVGHPGCTSSRKGTISPREPIGRHPRDHNLCRFRGLLPDDTARKSCRPAGEMVVGDALYRHDRSRERIPIWKPAGRRNVLARPARFERCAAACVGDTACNLLAQWRRSSLRFRSHFHQFGVGGGLLADDVTAPPYNISEYRSARVGGRGGSVSKLRSEPVQSKFFRGRNDRSEREHELHVRAPRPECEPNRRPSKATRAPRDIPGSQSRRWRVVRRG
jgi:hypothetical protein